MQKKLQRNEFTLQDMLEQFQQVKKMGDPSKLLEMMPGMANMGAQNVDLSQMKRQEAIILSMTYKERLNHLIIGPSRRKRIAKGSGTSVADVNKLIKQFEKMKLTMKKLSRNGSKMSQMMNRMGMDPSQMGGMGGLPGGLDPSQLKGMDMKKLMEIAKSMKR